jgi:hypothetical protein
MSGRLLELGSTTERDGLPLRWSARLIAAANQDAWRR